MTRAGVVASLVAAAVLAAAACSSPSTPAEAAGLSVFKVYNLSEISSRPFMPEDLEVFLAMMRDAVGVDEWYASESTVHVLDGVLTVRTSDVGHERLSRFFAQFRGMHQGGGRP